MHLLPSFCLLLSILPLLNHFTLRIEVFGQSLMQILQFKLKDDYCTCTVFVYLCTYDFLYMYVCIYVYTMHIVCLPDFVRDD